MAKYVIIIVEIVENVEESLLSLQGKVALNPKEMPLTRELITL